MIRIASLFWLALVAISGFATFKVKYAVQDIEEELNKARKQTIAEQQEIHVLRAEWTALNQPERLADLNRRFLSLAATTPKQLQHRIEDIPLRPTPKPAELLVAAVPAPPAPQTAAADVPPPADRSVPASALPAGAPPEPDTVVAATPAPKPPVANLQLISSAEAAPAAAPALLKPMPSKPETRPQVAKARPASQPRALDKLIDEIAGSR